MAWVEGFESAPPRTLSSPCISHRQGIDKRSKPARHFHLAFNPLRASHLLCERARLFVLGLRPQLLKVTHDGGRETRQLRQLM
eukprot:2571600-Pleurochrysis_carterae.AAC.3